MAGTASSNIQTGRFHDARRIHRQRSRRIWLGVSDRYGKFNGRGDTGRPYLCDTMTGASWQHDGRAWLSMGTPLGAPHADK
jgi:hypothetical protein